MENGKRDILLLFSTSFLFRGLDSQQLEEIAQKTTFAKYPAGHILVEEGIVNDKIICILEGLVKIYKLTKNGKEVFLVIEKTNNFLGVMDLDDKPSTATIETLQSTKVLIFHKRDLAGILQKNPLLWKRMYQIILAKLREFNELHSIILGNNLHERTYLLLCFLSRFTIDHTVFLSQESIAHLVGATRPRVTETLHTLQQEKKINISSKKITILSSFCL